MFIKTTRGWRQLHKRKYEVAKLWRKDGLDFEKTVAERGDEYWISNHNFSYWEVMDRLVYSARQRAKKLGIPCSISIADFDIPKLCPLRHVPFRVGDRQPTDDSPTLDRKDPRLGYVKGNVWVISHKANRLKGDFTPNELKTFCENVFALEWVNWTSEDENTLHETLQRQQAEQKRQKNEMHRPRWWLLWGPKSEVK